MALADAQMRAHGIAAAMLILLLQVPPRAYFAIALRKKGGRCLDCRSNLIRRLGCCWFLSARPTQLYKRKSYHSRNTLPTPLNHRKCKESPLGCGRAECLPGWAYLSRAISIGVMPGPPQPPSSAKQESTIQRYTVLYSVIAVIARSYTI